MTGDSHLLPASIRKAASRRSFLAAGALGVGGLTLADFTRMRAEGAVRPSAAGNSVILFWLSGGPGHMETWDPKPRAPAEYRGPFWAIETSVPGIQFGELLPEQSRWPTSSPSSAPSTMDRATTPKAITGC